MNSTYKYTLVLTVITIFFILSPFVSFAEQASDSHVETLTGSGEYDEQNGEALDASFRSPQSILIQEDGSLLISDTENHRIRQLQDGEVSTLAGFEFYEVDENGNPVLTLLDGDAETAVFNSPKGLASDQEGNIYIADAENHAIRKINTKGEVTTLAGDGVQGLEDGQGEEARFYHPTDIVVAQDGTLYVADSLNHVIRKVTQDGTVTTINAPSERVVEVAEGYPVPTGDYKDGRIKEATFNEPSGLAIDEKGNLYVADSGNQVIRYIDFQNDEVSIVAGRTPNYEENVLYADSGYRDARIRMAEFNFPKGISLTKEGGLVVADSINHAIRYIYNKDVTTIAGNGEKGDVDGSLDESQLHNPTDVAVTTEGNIIIADSYNNKIRQLTPVEQISEPEKEQHKESKDQSPEETEKPEEPKKEQQDKPAYREYVVQPGDWLSRIAIQFDTTWAHLQEINELDNPNLIIPGQTLLVP